MPFSSTLKLSNFYPELHAEHSRSTAEGSNPFLFFLKQHRHPIGFAGLYDIWHDNSTGENLHAFSIITVPSNTLVRKIQVQRMPVILPYKLESAWLRQDLTLIKILDYLTRYPSKEMDGYPVTDQINLPGSYSKEMLKPAGKVLSTEEPLPPIKIQPHYGHKKRPETPNQPWSNRG